MPALPRSILVLALLAAACAPATPTPPGGAAPADGGTMRIRLTFTTLDTFNPVTAVGGGVQVANAVYDKLVAVNAKGEVVPYVARSWKITPTSITFTLRSDVKCHDGTTVTPTVVANSFKYLFDPATSAQGRPRNFGAGPWYVSGDDADGTVTVTFATPYSDAIYGFASPTFAAAPIICPAGLKDPKVLDREDHGSGPYILRPGGLHAEDVTLEANPDWKWGPFGVSAGTPGRPSKLVLQMVGNDTTAANLLLTGGLDAALVSGPDAARLQGEKAVTTYSGTANVTWTLHFNHRAGRPTTDPALRQAIMTAVNQNDFMKAAWNGFGVGSTSLLRPGTECFDPDTKSLFPEPSLDRAKSILASAGYKPGPNGKLQKPNGEPLTLALLGVSGSNHGNGEDYIFAQLTSLGLDVKLNKAEVATWLRESQAGNFDLDVIHSGGNTPALMVATVYGDVPTKGGNYSAVQDPVLDKEVPAAFASVGKDKCDHYAAVQRAYLRGFHVMPLGIPQSFVFSRGFAWEPLFGGPGSVGSGVDFQSLVRKS